MTEAQGLMRRFERMIGKTAHAKNFEPEVWWEGERALERKIYDDRKAGRAQMNDAYSAAELGMKELKAGNIAAARSMAWLATDFYVEALERKAARVRSDSRKTYDEPAKRRGRPLGSANKKGRLAPTK